MALKGPWHRRLRAKRSRARNSARLCEDILLLSQHHGSKVPKLVAAALGGRNNSETPSRPSTSASVAASSGSPAAAAAGTAGVLDALRHEVLSLRSALAVMQSQMQRLVDSQHMLFVAPSSGAMPATAARGDHSSLVVDEPGGADPPPDIVNVKVAVPSTAAGALPTADVEPSAAQLHGARLEAAPSAARGVCVGRMYRCIRPAPFRDNFDPFLGKVLETLVVGDVFRCIEGPICEPDGARVLTCRDGCFGWVIVKDGHGIDYALTSDG